MELEENIHDYNFEEDYVSSQLNKNLFEVNNLTEFNDYLTQAQNLLKEEETLFGTVKADSLKTLDKVETTKLNLIKELEDLTSKYKNLNESVQDLEKSPPTWLSTAKQNIQLNNNLTKMEVYMILVSKVDYYTESAINQILNSEETNINKLEGYRSIVKLLQDWPTTDISKVLQNLYDYTKQNLNYIQFELQNSIINKLELLLKSVEYPQKPLNLKKIQPIQVERLNTLYSDLLLFQLECYLPYQQVIQQESLQTGILPLDVLIYPIWVRFQYHFMSQQPTNNAEKPEWFIQFILDNIKNQLKLFIQVEKFGKGLFQSYHRNSTKISSKKFSSTAVFVDWISSLIQHQLNYLKPQHLQNPHTLAHTIKELIDFDFTIRDDILKKYPKLEWEPISVVYLKSDTIKNAWLESEYKVVTVKLQEILSDREAWDYVYYDSSLPLPSQIDDEFDMPTHSVDRMFSVFEAITERYQHVLDPRIKLLYFEKVHYPLLGDYLGGMRRVYKGFERKYLGFRTPGGPPVTRPDHDNLAILQKLIHSSNFLIEQVKYLENEQIFLELWSLKYEQFNNDDDIENEGLFDHFISELEQFIQDIQSTLDSFTKPSISDTLSKLT